MAVTTLTFPFVMGLNQTIDDRLLEPGRPRAIENLAIRKQGRLGMRYDYDSLATTVQGGGTLNLFDLVSAFGRLFALGEVAESDFSPQSPSDFIEYSNEPLFAWRLSVNPAIVSQQTRLPIATHLRNIGSVSRSALSATTDINMDVAAGNGLICMVWQEAFATSEIVIHIVDAATDATLVYERLSGFALPRVVCTGTKFFIGCTNNTLTTPKLFRYDPAVDTTLTALTDPAGAGGAINSFDMSLSHEGTTFWMAYGRAGPTTRVHGFNADGTETHDFAGPNVLCFFITVFTEAMSGAGRIHLACVINATNAVNMSTYLTATSGLETNTAALFTGATSQVGMCAIHITASGFVNVILQQGADLFTESFVNNTHALTGNPLTYGDAVLNSKLLNCRSHSLFTFRALESLDGSSTHYLGQLTRVSGAFITPCAISDRSIANACNAAELPNLAFDATRGKCYWARPIVSTGGQVIVGRRARVAFMEAEIASQSRRQTATLGDGVYVAGGIVTQFDGRSLAEAGVLGRPIAALTSQGFSGVGALVPLGTYQFVSVAEYFDANGNRIQSIPSEVVEVTLTGVNNSIVMESTDVQTLRFDNQIVSSLTEPSAGLSIVFYRTKNTDDGNLTFYRDDGTVTQFPGEQSDDDLAENEVLYTQGERGALSGPLPFVAPEAAGSIAASADRILTGQLPYISRIQESRGLFPSEQANWSDSIGFIRDTRGRVLAVARLDERRIVYTADELLEMDGPGLDDNGNGDLGAPRRLPSDVGLYGGELGWRSIVECSIGLMWQGLIDQIYLLPRGGTVPQPIGMAVQDRLAAFPVITSATYISADRTVRFTCNNVGGTDGIQLLYDVVEQAWVTEGPFGFPLASSCQYQSRMTVLGSNVVRQQRASHPPVALISNAWRSGSIHPFKLGGFGHFLNVQFYGEYRGDCLLRCIATFDDGTVETLPLCEVNARTLAALSSANNLFLSALTSTVIAAGAPFSAKFTASQIKCECVRVDFEVEYPFPNVVAALTELQASAANSISVDLSTVRAVGDRVVVVIQASANGANAAALAGWTQVTTNTTQQGRQTILTRILDGTEATPAVFTWTGTATAAFALSWTIRNPWPIQASGVEIGTVSPNSSSALSANGAILTPSWGALNTLWLTVLCLDERPAAVTNVVRQPALFRRGINASQTTATANLSGQIIGGDRALNAASLTPNESPTAWGWTDPSDARNFTIAIRPNPELVSEGLAYHYWTMDVEGADKSALKSPLQLK